MTQPHIDFDRIEWTHPCGSVFKVTYDEPLDYELTPAQRDSESVRRIRLYLYAVSKRQPQEQAA